MGWTILNYSERSDYLHRYERGQELSELASELGMLPQTLGRRLREHRQAEDSGYIPPTERPKQPFKLSNNKAKITGDALRVAFPTDEHAPYQDDAARSVALQIVADFKPDVMVAGSDAMDFYSVSRFNKDPDRLRDGGLQREIDTWEINQREWLSAAPSAAFYYLEGNHEARLKHYLWRNPELHGLEVLKLPVLLGLANKGITYVGGEISINQRLVIKHGRRVSKHSAYTAKAELEDEKHSISVMSGHTHRGGSHYVTTRTGMVHAHEGFCLCSLEPEYVSNPNWQHGILLSTVFHERPPHVEAIAFHTVRDKIVAYWRGKEYVSE